MLYVRGEAKPTHLEVGCQSGGRKPSRAGQAEGPCLLGLFRGNVSAWGWWGQSPSHWATQNNLLTRRQRALKPPGSPETINQWMGKCDWRKMQKKKKPSQRQSKQQDGQKNIYNTHDKTGVDGCWFTEFITREKMMNNSIGKRVPDLKRRIKRKGIQMDNKCIKICSDSSTIKETQIKMKCLFLFIGLARILKYDPIQQ